MIPLSVVTQGIYVTEVPLISGTLNNFDLYSYFKTKMGREPRSKEKIIFTTSSTAKIRSLDVTKSALTLDTWPNLSNTIDFVNYGIIYGAGGNGGSGAHVYRKDSLTSRFHLPDTAVTGKINAEPGGNGGVGISNRTSNDLTITNYGKIYGGGGGGGGSAAYALGFAVFSKKNADTKYLTLSPDGNRIVNYLTGGGAGGGGAPYGECGLTALSLPWIAKKYPDVANEVSSLFSKIESLEKSDKLLRDNLSFSWERGVAMPIAPPQNFYSNNIDIGNRRYYGYAGIEDVIYNRLKVHKNRFVIFYNDLTEAKRATYRPYLPKYSDYYDSKYVNGDYAFYSGTQTSGYTGTGDSNIAGMARFAQRRQRDALELTGGVGGSLTGESMTDGLQRTYEAFGGWKTNTSTNKLYQLRDSINGIRGGNGGNLGEDGEDGRLDRIYYRGGSSGNSYTYFSPTHVTRMDVLQPGAGGKAGYIKTGNVTIINKTGGVTKGR